MKLTLKLLKIILSAVCILFANVMTNGQLKDDPRKLENDIRKADDNIQKVELFVNLSEYYLNKPGESKVDIDKAEQLKNKGQNLSRSLNYQEGNGNLLLLEAKILREKGDSGKALKKANEALSYGRKNNLSVLPDAYRELCAYLGYQEEDIRQKIKYMELAVPLYKKYRLFEKEGNALKELGDYYSILGEHQKSLMLLENAVSVYKSIGFKKLQGVYTLMSGNYGVLQNSQMSLQYALMAEKTAEDVGDTSYNWCTIYNHLGLAYYDVLKYDLAFANFEKSLDIALKHKNVSDINVLTYNLASLYCQQKNYRAALRILKRIEKTYPPADELTMVRRLFMFTICYSLLKQPANAEPYYKQLLKKYNESEVGLYYKLNGIIIYLQNSGHVEETYAYIKKFKEFAKKADQLILYSQIELLEYQSDHAAKRYESAIKHLKQHQVFRDSLFNMEKLKHSKALEVQFETEKKDKNIKLLTHQRKLQEATIQNEKVIRHVFIGSLIILILFLALLYNSFRAKKRKNDELELKRKQIDEQNEQLKKLLAEKEWLVKEIHHRVKNNLQIVISLLNTQSAYLDNEDALMAIQNSQHRMHAMSLIHQKLYQSDNLSTIDMSWYIYELINYIKECYSAENKIKFILNVEKFFLDVAQAVPLGLIINEALINTTKYAFPNDRKGEVELSLKNIENSDYELVIADNGVGLPEDFDIDETESLGMNLMRGLTDQLDGTFTLENKNGLKIIVTFRKNTEIEASN